MIKEDMYRILREDRGKLVQYFVYKDSKNALISYSHRNMTKQFISTYMHYVPIKCTVSGAEFCLVPVMKFYEVFFCIIGTYLH